MKRSGGVVHAIVECKNCSWQSGSYKNALAIASNHAKKYNHDVHVEVGYCFTYHGSEE